MKIVVFLDIDGVLHTDPCPLQYEMENLHLVEEVLLEYRQHIEIVISSAWRLTHTLAELRTHFSADLQPLVIGITPSIKYPSPLWLGQKAPQWEREWEIETWLQENHRDGPWLAIDDRPSLFREICLDLLITDRTVGFTAEQQQTLRLMLRQRRDEL